MKDTSQEILSYNDFQIRLTVPDEWIDPLDTIAKTKFISRLALLRNYVREGMKQDLVNLEKRINENQQFQDTCSSINAHLENIESD